MQVAQFFQRFGTDGNGYRNPGEPRCHGRIVCVDCPRDNQTPPLLAFRLPVHIRLHRERFPTHAIRFWCWTHYAFEPEGDDLLVIDTSVPAPAIGVCNKDGNIWAVNADRRLCLICGRPPDYTVSLEVPGGAPDGPGGVDGTAAPTPASTVGYPLACPLCQGQLVADITPDSISLRSVQPDAGLLESAAADAPPSAAANPSPDDQHTASQAEPPAGALADAPPAETPAEAPSA
jgi:hypothetical protein